MWSRPFAGALIPQGKQLRPSFLHGGLSAFDRVKVYSLSLLQTLTFYRGTFSNSLRCLVPTTFAV